MNCTSPPAAVSRLGPVRGDGELLGDDAVVPEDYHDVHLEGDREQVGPDRRTAKVPGREPMMRIMNESHAADAHLGNIILMGMSHFLGTSPSASWMFCTSEDALSLSV